MDGWDHISYMIRENAVFNRKRGSLVGVFIKVGVVVQGLLSLCLSYRGLFSKDSKKGDCIICVC